MALGEFSIAFEQQGIPVFNTGYLSWDTDTQSGINDAASILAANWAANILPSLSVDLQMIFTEVRSLDDAKIATSLAGAGQNGAQAGDAAPVSIAAVITRLDPTSRRKGRWYIPGVPEDKVDGGRDLDLNWYSNLRAQFEVSRSNMAAQDNTQFMNRHKIGPGAYAYASINAFGIQDVVGSQSRRRNN